MGNNVIEDSCDIFNSKVKECERQIDQVVFLTLFHHFLVLLEVKLELPVGGQTFGFFSMGRYIRSERGGGRLPNIKYLSNHLLNRITIEEKDIYSRMVPEVNNNLSCDHEYAEGVPDRTVEALQAWEAISALNQNIISDDLEKGLNNLKSAIRISMETYMHLSSRGFSEGIEAITEYLNALDGALEVFKRLAEL